jgi:hypothetical protein
MRRLAGALALSSCTAKGKSHRVKKGDTERRSGDEGEGRDKEKSKQWMSILEGQALIGQ